MRIIPISVERCKAKRQPAQLAENSVRKRIRLAKATAEALEVVKERRHQRGHHPATAEEELGLVLVIAEIGCTAVLRDHVDVHAADRRRPGRLILLLADAFEIVVFGIVRVGIILLFTRPA